MTLRILHVIPSLAAGDGGPTVAVTGMCRALRERQVDARVATTDADGRGRLGVAVGVWIDWNGIPTIFFRRLGRSGFKPSPALARWLRVEVRRFDVVHVHAVFNHSSLAAARACRCAGVPFVVRPLGTLDPWSLSQKPLRKRLAWWLGVGRCMRAAAAFHYTSEAERRRTEAALGLRRGVVIPLGVTQDLDALAGAGQPPASLRGAPYVVALGRLHPKKNLEQLIEAFAAISAPAARLAIVGDGDPDYASRLRRLARARVGDRVVFTGWLTGAEKAATIAGATALAMPSLQENFGLSAAEAMALGVPVVLGTGVDLSDEVREAGAGWVVRDDVEELAGALHAALTNPSLRAARAERARALARTRYAWPRIAEQLERLYGSPPLE